MTSETEIPQVEVTASPDKQADEESASKHSSAGPSSPKPDADSEDQESGEGVQNPEGEEVSEEVIADVEALKAELDKIKVEAPTMKRPPAEVFDPAEFPESYKENLPKEKLVLAYAENFRRQYVHLYRDRKPLFINPLNECGIEKFVSTSLKPTQLPYQELYDWDKAAEFVADYLNYLPLDPAHELPERLISPSTVLKKQKGNCFEYSVLLASFLIASGYDAYVVSGYATRETCLMDETREICPLLQKREKAKQAEKTKEQKKYTVRPPKDLRSKFEMKMSARERKKIEDELEKQRQEAEIQQLESEKPPPDPLYGLRVHSWVLVLEGKREVPETFFIEPTTGNAHPATSVSYLGIESVWNNFNYWVNMQDCSEGCKNMKYDLGDCTLWEYMFPSNDKPILQIPEEDEIYDGMDEEEEADEVEKHLDLPPSWVEPIELSLKDFQMRCPQGKKTKLYKRAKLEKFAHYLMRDGLVCRLSIYEDRELTELTQIKEFFEHRADKLYERVHNQRNGLITEFFHPGRPRSLKEHQYKGSSPGHENDRYMIFYDEARVDGLRKRLETPLEMTEDYVNRDDYLYYRYVEFGKRPKKFGPAEAKTSRPILKMIERYHRNPKNHANRDIAELIFNIAEEKINITYHTEDDKISSSIREFIKPANAEEKGATLILTQDMHTTFQVNAEGKKTKNVELYEMLVCLIKAEEKCKSKVRDSEEEVREILGDRTKEEAQSELEISVYDTDRNEKAKKHRKELERLAMEEKMRRQELELDYLAPFLATMGDPEKINKQQAYKLKEECLADLKQRLIDKANLIQVRFEKETQELQKKQAWYQQNQVNMVKDDEEAYLNYCSEAMFRIHILELRLNRHKEMAPHKYMALEQKIRTDPRLSEYF